MSYPTIAFTLMNPPTLISVNPETDKLFRLDLASSVFDCGIDTGEILSSLNDTEELLWKGATFIMRDKRIVYMKQHRMI